MTASKKSDDTAKNEKADNLAELSDTIIDELDEPETQVGGAELTGAQLARNERDPMLAVGGDAAKPVT